MPRNVSITTITTTNRTRKNLGDITALAANIKEIGLLSPIIINEENKLLAGERRLEACKMLGWTEIPAIVKSTADAEHELLIEVSENEFRKSFTREELINAGLELERIEAAKAEMRMKAGKADPRLNSTQGKTEEIVAKKFGIGRDTYRKDKFVLEHRDLLSSGEFEDWNSGTASTNKAYTIIKAQLKPTEAPAAEKPREVVREVVKEIAPKDYADTKQKIAELEKQLADSKAQYSSLSAENSSLRSTISKKEEEIEYLLGETSEPDTAELDELRRKYDELVAERDELAKKQESSDDEIKQLKKERYSEKAQEVNTAYDFSRAISAIIKEYSQDLLYSDYFQRNINNVCEEKVVKACNAMIDFCNEVLKRQCTGEYVEADNVINLY